jgi:hypothetical protein
VIDQFSSAADGDTNMHVDYSAVLLDKPVASSLLDEAIAVLAVFCCKNKIKYY